MRRAVLIVVAACKHAAPHAAPPANTLETSGAEPTRMVVQVFPLYGTCDRVHHIAIAMDGHPQGVVETHAQCPPKPADTPGRSDKSAPFDVPAGPHVIEIEDRETQLVDKIERVFPQYEQGEQHRVLDLIGVVAEDNKLHIMGLSREFVLL